MMLPRKLSSLAFYPPARVVSNAMIKAIATFKPK